MIERVDDAIARLEDARYSPAEYGITDADSLSAFIRDVMADLRGGGMAEIAALQAEVVAERGWKPNRLYGPLRQMQDEDIPIDKIIPEMLVIFIEALTRYRSTL